MQIHKPTQAQLDHLVPPVFEDRQIMITVKQIVRATAALVAAASVQGAMAANASVSVNTSSLTTLGSISVTGIGNDTFASTGANAGTVTAPIISLTAALADFAATDGFTITADNLFLGTNTVSFTDFALDIATGMLSGSLKGSGGILGKLNYSGQMIDATTITGTTTLQYGSFTLASGLSSYLSANGVNPALVPVGDIIRTVSFAAPAAIPEPSTYALMGLGLVGVALTARKRKAA
jgi:PEP-CTERM motif